MLAQVACVQNSFQRLSRVRRGSAVVAVLESREGLDPNAGVAPAESSRDWVVGEAEVGQADSNGSAVVAVPETLRRPELNVGVAPA